MAKEKKSKESIFEITNLFVNYYAAEGLLFQHALKARSAHIERFHRDLPDSVMHVWVLELSLQFSCALCNANIFTLGWADTRGAVFGAPLIGIETYKAASKMLRVLENLKGLEGDTLKQVEQVIREAKGLEDWQKPTEPSSDKIRLDNEARIAAKHKYFNSF